MSIHFIVTPYDPIDWENQTSDLSIEAEQFSDSLKKQWPNVTIEITTNGGLKWNIPLDESAGFFGALQSNKQVITFGPGDWIFFREFVMWYRNQVPDNYTLYLFNSSSTDNLPITTSTVIEDVNDFVDRSKSDKQ